MAYYKGIVCSNAHRVVRLVFRYEDAAPQFCDQCGAKAHGACLNCGKPLRAGEVPSTIQARKDASALDNSWPIPWYCYECGTAYPWTSNKVESARSLIGGVEDLTSAEREGLSSSLEDLLADTPRSEQAALTWKKALSRIGGPARSALVKVATDVATAGVRHIMGSEPVVLSGVTTS